MLAVVDSVIRIKNGYLASRESVDVPHTKLVQNILEKLVAEGYIQSFDVETDGPKKSCVVHLTHTNGKSKFTDLKLMSKPGQKTYVSVDEIPKVLNGLGIAILSTTNGIMTGKEARKAGIGGELLFTIW
ncbi:MAG: 30S ribosomal protein S8 [Candidatus Roizmanbacteria bacterium]